MEQMNAQKIMSLSHQSTAGSVAASGPVRSPRNRVSRGQSAVEFALLSVFALAVMLVGVQYALIGQAAVAVSQGSSALARYVSSNLGNYIANGTVKASTLPLAAQQVLPQSLMTNGGADLTVTVNSYQGDGVTTEANPPAPGEQVVITLSYDTKTKIAVPNPFLQMPPLFPGITFPRAVGATDSQMYEY
jgi:Flp pilus assembly protein TadG